MRTMSRLPGALGPSTGRHLLAGIAAVCLILGGCSSDDSDPPDAGAPASNRTGTTTSTEVTSSPGCTAAVPVRPGTTDRTMTSGGERREYQLVVPEAYDGTSPLPVVFALHPDVISNRVVPSMVGFPDAATGHDFVVGGGHTWPNRPVPAFEETFGYTTLDIDATELMFEFFFAQQR